VSGSSFIYSFFLIIYGNGFMIDAHLKKEIDEALEDVREGRIINWNELQRFWKEHH